MSSIYGMIHGELKARIEHLPEQYGKYKPAFDILDTESIAGLILDGDTFWFEWNSNGLPADKDILLLKEYITQKGYTYLYG